MKHIPKSGATFKVLEFLKKSPFLMPFSAHRGYGFGYEICDRGQNSLSNVLLGVNYGGHGGSPGRKAAFGEFPKNCNIQTVTRIHQSNIFS